MRGLFIPKFWYGPAVQRTSGGTLQRLLPQSNANKYSLRYRPCIPINSPLGSPANNLIHRRCFLTDSLPNALAPPVVFLGLLVTLWTYKCMMTVIFQDKIIYMPYMPPFSRSEQIEQYVEVCKPVQWSHTPIRSQDGVKLSLCIGSVPQKEDQHVRKLIICYFQGNGASLPPRLSMLSQVLKAINLQLDDDQVYVSVVALSYRGYWTSSGRATESGIRKDSQAMLDWVMTTYGESAQIVLWGQSIGAGVACAAAADAVVKREVVMNRAAPFQPIALILETPFTSIKSMLVALYPQKWLPYQYLWPFLWNHWDSPSALGSIAASQCKPPILLLVAKRDEVVPPEEADKIHRLLKDERFETTRVDVLGSLHNEATTRREGQIAIAQFIARCVQDCRGGEGSFE